MKVVRNHDLVSTLKRPLTQAEQGRVVDRTGQVWKEKTEELRDLEEARAFLIVGPPVVFSFNKQAYANHPVVDLPNMSERFYRSENVDKKHMESWNFWYERVQ